jgi:hypothetical protein
MSHTKYNHQCLTGTCGLTAGDGAGSPIRKQLGIGWEGKSNLQHLVNVHFKAPSLGQHLLSRPAMLYFVYSSKSVMVLVAHDLQAGESLSSFGQIA